MTDPVLVLDEPLRSALRVAVRVLEEQAAAARAPSGRAGTPAPEVELYLDAADRLRAAASR